jgi:hypothetical protein
MADLQPVPIACPACGSLIGEEISVQGIVLIHAGGGLWRELRGYCAQCGKLFYWTASDKQLQQLIVDINNMRDHAERGGE